MHSLIKGRGSAFLASAGVLGLALGFLIYALTLHQGPSGAMVCYHAAFSSANGLEPGSEVALGGVNVGRVRTITLNPETAIADVAFDVEERLRLPEDTAVSVSSLTMGGDNVLALHPGKSKAFLKPNSTILDAQALLSLEQQISNYIFNAGKL